MKPNKPKFTKHQRKSPVVAVIVEQHPAPPLSFVLPEAHLDDTFTPAPLDIPTRTEEDKQKQKQTVKMIAETLGEPKEKRGQLYAIVKHLGCEASLALLAEVQVIEANGGMMTTKGDRRRTAGGVFFALVKSRYPQGHFRPARPTTPDTPHA